LPILTTLLILLPILLIYLGPAVLREADPKDAGPSETATHVEHLIGTFTEANRTFPEVPLIVDMTLFADVPREADPTYRRIVAGNEVRMKSAVSEVIRSLSHKDLREPTLATLKRKVKVAMTSVTGAQAPVFDHLLVPDFDARRMN
jgi:hypothetical protein